MADGYNLGQMGTMSPELYEQQQQLNRQQKMAQLLMQNTKQPQGQMIGNRFVAPSFLQNLVPLANMYVSSSLAKEGDEKALELSKALKAQHTDELNQFNQLLNKSPMEAYSFAAQAYNPALQKVGMEKMIPKEFELGEGQKRFITMPDGSVKEVASGGDKFQRPIEIDTGTAIELRDPRDPTKVLSRMAKSQMPTAGQVVEREDGTYLVDTRSGQARPILGPSGQPLMGGGKQLTESQGKASAFQSQMVSASNAVNTLESKGFDPTSFTNQTAVKLAGGVANPAIPVAAQQYKQAQDQWSEAYLRFKTGAAATEPEVVRNNRTFFPVFGDKPEQIAQKADAREQAERDIGIAAGRGSNLGAKAIGQQPKQEKQSPAGLPNQSAIDAELKRRGLK
jgi:hypothetical protein